MAARLTASLAALLLTASTACAQSTEAPAPRNIILMVADGCGFNHLRAAALWQDGAEMFTAWEDLPVRLAVSTYAEGGGYDPVAFWAEGPRNQPPTDSAAAITALTTGHKTRNGRLAMTGDGAPLMTVVEAMERGGRSTGVVTSVQFSHATPAGCVVQSLKRSAYLDISRGMLTNSAVDVVMGAGHPLHDHQGRPTATADYRNVGGEDTWQGLLSGAAGGDADGDGAPDPWTLVQDAEAFAALTGGEAPARVVGVARVRETLQQQRPGDPLAAPFAEPQMPGVPTLQDMALGAINVLDADPDGFFLMIEGGAVDWAAHNNQPGRLVEEVVGFARAVAAVRTWIDAHGGWSDNLLIITADHETGYLTGPAPADGPDPACRTRQPLMARGQGKLPEMRFNGSDHTNSLVPLFAAGVGSELLASRATGVDPGRGAYLDNTDIGAFLQEWAGRKAAPIVTK